MFFGLLNSLCGIFSELDLFISNIKKNYKIEFFKNRFVFFSCGTVTCLKERKLKIQSSYILNLKVDLLSSLARDELNAYSCRINHNDIRVS